MSRTVARALLATIADDMRERRKELEDPLLADSCALAMLIGRLQVWADQPEAQKVNFARLAEKDAP